MASDLRLEAEGYDDRCVPLPKAGEFRTQSSLLGVSGLPTGCGLFGAPFGRLLEQSTWDGTVAVTMLYLHKGSFPGRCGITPLGLGCLERR